jgi:hypothetical protein
MIPAIAILYMWIGIGGALECDRPWPKMDLYLPAEEKNRTRKSYLNLLYNSFNYQKLREKSDEI